MELQVDKRPLTAKFLSPVDIVLVAYDGSRCQRFEAGQTKPVHRDLYAPAIAAGLVPQEPLEFAEPKQPEKKPQEQLVMEGLKEACQTLIVRGNPGDFTLAGHPRAASAKKLVDFDFTTRDLHRAFEEAMHEVDQHGDESSEHSEPSSSAAE